MAPIAVSRLPLLPTRDPSEPGEHEKGADPTHIASAVPEPLTSLWLESNGALARTTCVLLLIPTAWFAWADVSLLQGDPSALALRLTARSAMIVALVYAAVAIPRSPTTAHYARRTLAVTVACAISLTIMAALRPIAAGLPLRTPMLWLFALYAGFHNRPRHQFIAPGILTAGLLLHPAFWDAGAQSESVSGNLLIILTINAIGVLLVHRRADLEVREARSERDAEARLLAERAQHELTLLKGIIPICSFCKKVRTEVGDWQQVEAYVRAHSAADFSHGLCPSCTQEHYGTLLSTDPPPKG